MFDWLTNLVSGSPVTYAVVFAVAALDVLFPLIPSETVALTAAVLSAHGDLDIALVVAAAAVGGFSGDNASFGLGRRVGDPVAEWLFRGEKGKRRLDWARRSIRERGGLVILVGRFLPGGRTGGTFAAGSVGMGWKRFARFDAPAALAWAIYVGVLGYVGGAAFRDSLWKPLALSAAVAVAILAVVEGYRRLLKRRGRELLTGDR
jgi:membrane-associated protein